jgi:hypothetical protein
LLPLLQAAAVTSPAALRRNRRRSQVFVPIRAVLQVGHPRARAERVYGVLVSSAVGVSVLASVSRSVSIVPSA